MCKCIWWTRVELLCGLRLFGIPHDWCRSVWLWKCVVACVLKTQTFSYVGMGFRGSQIRICREMIKSGHCGMQSLVHWHWPHVWNNFHIIFRWLYQGNCDPQRRLSLYAVLLSGVCVFVPACMYVCFWTVCCMVGKSYFFSSIPLDILQYFTAEVSNC